MKSLLVSKLFKNLLNKTHINSRGLIIHSARGSPYTSNQFVNLISSYKHTHLSHNEKASPKQNAVAERMVKCLKKQLLVAIKDIPPLTSIKDIQHLFQTKADYYNTKHKCRKNYGLTLLLGRHGDDTIEMDEPIHALAVNHPDHEPALDIKEKRRERAQLYKERNPLLVLNSVDANVLEVKADVEAIRQQIGDFKEDLMTSLEDIRERVTPKPKVFLRHRPLRDPIDGTIYQHLMDKPRKPKERIGAYYAFRIAITLLKHTGLRVGEIRTLTKNDINTLIQELRLQVYQVKQNRHREVIGSPYGSKQLIDLEEEINYLFLKKKQLV